MRRFNYGENEDYRDDNKFFEDEDHEEYDEYEGDDRYEEEVNLLEIIHINLEAIDINRRILSSAIKIAEKSFLWRLWPINWKLNVISNIYHTLDSLVDTDKYIKNKEEKEE